MEYVRRILDTELDELFDQVSAIAIDGPKGVGKTTTAEQRVASVPGRFAGFFESLVEFVHEQARSIVKGDLTYIAPLAFCSFLWIVLMNAMDFLPLDLLPKLWELYYSATGRDPHHAYLRVVPTADLNGTLSLAIVNCSTPHKASCAHGRIGTPTTN